MSVKPRIKVSEGAKAGDIIEIKTLISHEMESGQRRDAEGKPIPRKILNSLQASFNGKPFFTATWYPSISANPYQSFFFKATESGEFRLTWKDDDGSTAEHVAKLTVA